jgi:hypothetical protein
MRPPARRSAAVDRPEVAMLSHHRSCIGHGAPYSAASRLRSARYGAKKAADDEDDLLNPEDCARAVGRNSARAYRSLSSVAQPFLHCPDSVALLEQRRRTAGSKGMTASRLSNPRRTTYSPARILKTVFVKMMPTFFAATRVDCTPTARKDIPPAPFAARMRRFPFQRAG